MIGMSWNEIIYILLERSHAIYLNIILSLQVNGQFARVYRWKLVFFFVREFPNIFSWIKKEALFCLICDFLVKS